jgi:hypothetical protein
MVQRSAASRYLCCLYNYDHTFGEFLDESDTLRFRHCLVPAVFETSVHLVAQSARQAAALAYVQAVGQKKARAMKKMKAPAFMIKAETNPRAVTKLFGWTRIWAGKCLFFDNDIETWYIRVQRLHAVDPATMGRGRTQKRPRPSTWIRCWLRGGFVSEN